MCQEWSHHSSSIIRQILSEPCACFVLMCCCKSVLPVTLLTPNYPWVTLLLHICCHHSSNIFAPILARLALYVNFISENAFQESHSPSSYPTSSITLHTSHMWLNLKSDNIRLVFIRFYVNSSTCLHVYWILFRLLVVEVGRKGLLTWSSFVRVWYEASLLILMYIEIAHLRNTSLLTRHKVSELIR